MNQNKKLRGEIIRNVKRYNFIIKRNDVGAKNIHEENRV